VIRAIKAFFMKNLLLILSGVLLTAIGLQAQPYHYNRDLYWEEWQRIDSLEIKVGLPKTALAATNALYKKALREDNPAQQIKCLIRKIRLQDQLSESDQREWRTAYEAQYKTAEFPAKQILASMLGELYLNDAQYQTVRFDMAEDNYSQAEALRKKGQFYYKKSLENAALQKVLLSDFEAIRTGNENTVGMWTTLYDFLMHRRLKGEEQLLAAEGRTEKVDVEALFSSRSDFARLKLASLKLGDITEVLELYQQWMDFLKEKEDHTALVYADLQRYAFVKKHFKGSKGKSLYREALENMLTKEKAKERTEIQYALANHFYEEGRAYRARYQDEDHPEKWLLKEAVSLCEQAIADWPESFGAQQCQWLKDLIIHKELGLEMSGVLYPNEDFLALVSYKNVSKLKGRILPMAHLKNHQKGIREEAFIELLKKKESVQNISLNVPDPGDYHTHRAEFRVKGLETGRYFILLETTDGELVAVKEFYVSRLAVVENSDEGYEAYVMDRNSGLPLEDVELYLYEQNYRTPARYVESKTTDKNGFVDDSKSRSKQLRRAWVYGSDTLNTYGYYYYGSGPHKNKKRAESLMFTDRSLYRPGQQVYFKGVSFWNYGAGKTELLKNEKITVSFYDANHQLVEKQDLRTNDFGSVNGSFIIPDNGLNGRMTLDISHGSFRKSIRVEAYKRPKFELLFDPIEESYRPGDQVSLSGKAKAFAGSALDGASFSYQVKRRISFPYGCYFWRPIFSEEEEIAHGKGVLDENGTFQLSFNALESDALGENKNPEYLYTVVVDVTDLNGETQTEQSSVRVGAIAMNASLQVPEMIDRKEKMNIAIEAKNLNGETIDTHGRIQIERLEDTPRFLRNREWSLPDQYLMTAEEYQNYFPKDPFRDEHLPEHRKAVETVYDESFDTQKSKYLYRLKLGWPVGHYRIRFTAVDPYGKSLEQVYHFKVIDSGKGKLPEQEVICHYAPFGEVKSGETATFYKGNSLRGSHLLFRLERNGEILQENWLRGGKFLKHSITISDADRGNLHYQLVGMYENRLVQEKHRIEVPWADKELQLSYTVFRDKLKPGAKEEWEVKISGPEGERVQAELLMSMYDASLDAIQGHSWRSFSYPSYYMKRALSSAGVDISGAYKRDTYKRTNLELRKMGRLNWDMGTPDYMDYGYLGVRSRNMIDGVAVLPEMVDFDTFDDIETEEIELALQANFKTSVKQQKEESVPAKNKKVSIRKNLNETVFFYPDLKTDAEGNIVFSFTMNEALTKWKLMGYGHSKDMQQLYTEKEVLTQKELMVQPNPPRFLREGDQIVFTAKLSNLTEETINGNLRLEWLDALTMEKLGDSWHQNSEQPFSLEGKRNLQAAWTLQLPKEWTRPVVYRIVATSDRFSDGEEAAIPVLSNRILLHESVPLYVKGNSKKKAQLKNLVNYDSASGQHQKLTLELTENPAWYALQAMPYMMEYPHECSEQLFSRFYANSLAEDLMHDKPAIQQLFEHWKKSDALESALHKNTELKNILLEETPWVFEAEQESTQKKRLALLFDFNQMKNNKERNLKKLINNQLSDGSFPWFKGGRGNAYITRHIMEGFGHLKQMNVSWDIDVDRMLERAIAYIDAKALESYRRLEERVTQKKTHWDAHHINRAWIHYLYTRTYFTDQHPLPDEQQEVFRYFSKQARAYWATYDPYMAGMIALAMQRSDQQMTTDKIVASLKEKAIHSDELGVYWKQGGWHWYQLPIEQQALLIELMHSVGEKELTEEAKRWLLSQKRTQHWSTTKGTAAAVYALLNSGQNWLEEGQSLQVELGGKALDLSADKEAGTGYQKIEWNTDQIKAEMGKLEIENPNSVPAWAALHWQHFEDRSAVKASAKGPLAIKKKMFVEQFTDDGVELQLWEEGDPLQVGDKIRVQLLVKANQAMNYVHVKDGRASALEPVQQTSRYYWNQTFAYYQSIGDAAMHFFIDYLPKGTHVLEYDLRITHEGKFSGGVAEIMSMYAPEFSGHSEGRSLQIK
jgi:hypothetical protein